MGRYREGVVCRNKTRPTEPLSIKRKKILDILFKFATINPDDIMGLSLRNLLKYAKLLQRIDVLHYLKSEQEQRTINIDHTFSSKSDLV